MPKREAAAVEVNFDGLPGPTHNYSGLATGNLASERNRLSVANPRLAALQGLAKMKALADRGYPQAVLPPHERPDLAALRALGYHGDDASVIARAARDDSPLLAACSSAAAMWAANAATVSPSADTADRRVHFTPANLTSHFHRAIEARDDHPGASCDLRRRGSLCRARAAAVRRPIRRRRRGQPHAIRFRRDRSRHRALRLRAGRVRYGGELAIAFSGAADARSLAGDRAAPWPRPHAHLVRPAEPGGDRRRRIPQRRDCRRQRGGAVLSRKRVRRAASIARRALGSRRRGVHADRRSRGGSERRRARWRRICSTASF